MTRRRVHAIAPVVCALLAGCALTAKGEPLRPRYFTPEATGVARAPEPARPPAAANVRLKLGRVLAGTHLRERIPYRDSEHEVGYYAERRWTERPDAYLRRALERALFEERGATRVVSGDAPTLDVELTAFEELRAPVHAARLQAIAILHDERIGHLEQTITVQRPIADASGERAADAMVQALSEALAQVVAEISDRVLAQVAASPQTPALDQSARLQD